MLLSVESVIRARPGQPFDRERYYLFPNTERVEQLPGVAGRRAAENNATTDNIFAVSSSHPDMGIFLGTFSDGAQGCAINRPPHLDRGAARVRDVHARVRRLPHDMRLEGRS